MATREERSTETSMTPPEVRPFRMDVPEEDLVDLRRLIAATNWPEKETVADQSQGVPLAMLQKLARYWATDYDWRKCEENDRSTGFRKGQGTGRRSRRKGYGRGILL